MNYSNEDMKVYKQGLKDVENLVEEVIERCDDIADENDYEKEWVLEQFKNAFNKAKRVRNNS